MSFDHIFLNKFPTPYHRGGDSPAFDVVVVENQIDVYNREDNEAPHQHVVQKSHRNVASHHRYNPGKELGKGRVTHGRIHSKSSQTLQQEDQEGEKIDEAGQRVVANRIDFLVRQLENIHLDHIQNFFPLTAFERDEIGPACELISGKSPVGSENEVEKDESSRGFAFLVGAKTR